MSNFLYNGVELPDINTVWTDELKAQYSYAYVGTGAHVSTGEAEPRLIFSGEKKTANADGRGIFLSAASKWRLVNGEWVINQQSNASILLITWSNTDVYYGADVEEVGGTLYLAASTPVPVVTNTLDPTAMLMGWLVGKRVAGLRKTQTDVPVVPDVPDTPDEPSGDPVAYLYNGVQLPEIKSYEVGDGLDLFTICPYHFLVEDNGEYTLRVTDNVPYINANGYLTLRPTAVASLVADDGEWYLAASLNISSDTETGFKGCHWTNADILNTDGTTYLAASEPVPVYE